MDKVFVRNPYNYDMDQASVESGLSCPEPTLAQQHFKDECDINVIVERFHLTGDLPLLDKLPTYGDFTGIFDFQTAMNAIRQATETFMELPANLRARFHNSEQEFLEFCSDDNNRDEAKKLGILKEPEQTAGSTTGAPTHGTQAAGIPQNTPQTTAGTGGTQASPGATPTGQKP